MLEEKSSARFTFGTLPNKVCLLDATTWYQTATFHLPWDVGCCRRLDAMVSLLPKMPKTKLPNIAKKNSP